MIDIVPVERLELRFAPKPWPFAHERRGEIDAHFAALKRLKPGLWNGRVLLLHEWAFDDGVLRGAYFETDFASFIAWRDWGCPDRAIRNCFATGVLRAADGAFLLGIMGAHTANAGKIYFPAGTPDPTDIRDGTVDLGGSLMRELTEETGLTEADIVAEPGWHAVRAGARIALMKSLQAAEPAATLHGRILAHLARDKEPELAGIHIARGVADLDPRMPDFVTAFLNHAWRRERASLAKPRAVT